MPRRSPLFLLADHLLLPGGLEEFVRTRRATGMSWRRITLDIYNATDRVVDITPQALFNWFKDGANDDQDAA